MNVTHFGGKKMVNKTNSVDPITGTKIYNGSSELTKGNHDHMPKRTDAYLSTDERGHIQASSLGGTNNEDNITPQAKDLNHGAYYQMEQGERNALKQGHTIESEKIAYSSVQPGNRPDAYIVNDTITYADGQKQEIHHSFANMMNNEQENLNASLNEHSDMLDVSNPNDSLREQMTTDEYANLMEKTDAELPNIRDTYEQCTYVTSQDISEATNIFEENSVNIDENIGVDATNTWEASVENSDSLETGDMNCSTDVAADMDCGADME